MKYLITIVYFNFLFLNNLYAESDSKFFELFRQDSYSAMQMLPKKTAGSENENIPLKQLNELFFKEHAKEREKFCITQQLEDGSYVKRCLVDGRAGIVGSDKPEYLIDHPQNMIDNIYELDGRLQAAHLTKNPWSSDYWALRSGATAKRYRDRHFPDGGTWKSAYDYFLSHGADPHTYNDLLSPAEKYDLLVGDANWTLTKQQWGEGQQYHVAHNEVERWMGICHGWAPASYMEKRPAETIEVLSANNIPITFYPDDIKALTVLKWANGTPVIGGRGNTTRFIGGRCDAKNPTLDPENGRLKDNNCFDNNPSSWHIAITNQIGKSKRSFVMDATYDYEVWNQPVLSYKYRYFNPKTLKEVSSLKDAIININDRGFEDKFKNYRNPDAKLLVGVIMEVVYMVETQPEGRSTDEPQYDATRGVEYYYDLELSQDGSIIGGEWYQNAHPDFLWSIEKGAVAVNPADRFVKEKWDPRKPLQKSIAQVAPSSSRSGAPLRAVVDGLIAASARE